MAVDLEIPVDRLADHMVIIHPRATPAFRCQEDQVDQEDQEVLAVAFLEAQEDHPDTLRDMVEATRRNGWHRHPGHQDKARVSRTTCGHCRLGLR